MPRLSVIIPAWCAAAHLGRCLDALEHQDAPPGAWELLVVDDASADGTAAVAERAGVTVLRHEHNRGAAAARNTGARAARGETLLFIDSDVVPAPTLVSAALALIEGDQPVLATGRYEPEPANDGFFPRYKALWTWHAWEVSAGRSGSSTHLQGALALVDAALFDQVGGFDERFAGGSVEDYELSERLTADARTIRFAPGLTGRHHFPGPRTVARNYWQRGRAWARLDGGRRFSTGQAQRRTAVSAGAAAVGAAGRLALPVAPWLVPAVAAADLVYLAAARPFLERALREQGLRFALGCAVTHWGLQAVAGAAVLRGAVEARINRV